MFANLLPRIASLFGQSGAQAIVAGVVAGTLAASVLLATGIIPVGGSDATSGKVELLACPGIGPVLARIEAGQSTLVTARDASGEWLEVYIGEPGIQRAWAPAQALRLQSSVDRLPIHDCSVPARSLPPPPSAPPSAAPSTAPSPSLVPDVVPTPSATLVPTPTPRPTRTVKPTAAPTPSPTPFVDLTPPVLSNLKITSPNPFGGQYTVYNSGPGCSHSFTVEVNATDPDDAVSGVTIFYQGTFEVAQSAPMVFISGSLWRYSVTVPPTWDLDDVIAFWVRGVDSHGNQSANLHNDAASQHVVIDLCPPA